MSRGYRKIYEDDWLIVIDKPAGQLSVPSPGKVEVSLLNLLQREYKNIFPCHRLDKETSGLVIFAKDKQTQEKIFGLFRERKIAKTYLAVVHGWLKKDHGELRSRIREKNIRGSISKLAVTKFKVTKKNVEYSALEAYPLTGRKNQIRIQFAESGHPIVGERRFAFAKEFELKSKRLCLHAWKLSFCHPGTKQNLNITSVVPEEIKKFF